MKRLYTLLLFATCLNFFYPSNAQEKETDILGRETVKYNISDGQLIYPGASVYVDVQDIPFEIAFIKESVQYVIVLGHRSNIRDDKASILHTESVDTVFFDDRKNSVVVEMSESFSGETDIHFYSATNIKDSKPTGVRTATRQDPLFILTLKEGKK